MKLDTNNEFPDEVVIMLSICVSISESENTDLKFVMNFDLNLKVIGY